MEYSTSEELSEEIMHLQKQMNGLGEICIASIEELSRFKHDIDNDSITEEQLANMRLLSKELLAAVKQYDEVILSFYHLQWISASQYEELQMIPHIQYLYKMFETSVEEYNKRKQKRNKKIFSKQSVLKWIKK